MPVTSFPTSGPGFFFYHHCCWGSSSIPTQCQLGWLECCGLLSSESLFTHMFVVGADLSWAVRWDTSMWSLHVAWASLQHGGRGWEGSVLREWARQKLHYLLLTQKSCSIMSTTLLRSHKALSKFKRNGNRLHVLMEGDKILEEHVGIEILLWPFWGHTVGHTHHGAPFTGHHAWVPGIAVFQWGPRPPHYSQVILLSKLTSFVSIQGKPKASTLKIIIIMQSRWVLFVSPLPFRALLLTLPFITKRLIQMSL